MNPLMLAILLGQKDSQLFDIIRDLERIRDSGISARISVRELDILVAAHSRLERITRPAVAA